MIETAKALHREGHEALKNFAPIVVVATATFVVDRNREGVATEKDTTP